MVVLAVNHVSFSTKSVVALLFPSRLLRNENLTAENGFCSQVGRFANSFMWRIPSMGTYFGSLLRKSCGGRCGCHRALAAVTWFLSWQTIQVTANLI